MYLVTVIVCLSSYFFLFQMDLLLVFMHVCMVNSFNTHKAKIRSNPGLTKTFSHTISSHTGKNVFSYNSIIP